MVVRNRETACDRRDDLAAEVRGCRVRADIEGVVPEENEAGRVVHRVVEANDRRDQATGAVIG